ncbi:MAG: glycosyltransferase [Ardenticatenaceae bacterium]|nr:glycosyltransferase [Ardenticatenaceae bacterium]MCB8990103.1 glycosyltransferase [Ardenticatenaceae bacterium]
MNILFLTQIIPYPPNAGPRVKTWNVLRYLTGQGHEVTLVSFVRPDEEAFVPALREVCTAVHTIPIRRSRLADVVYLLRSQVSGRPFLIERDDLKGMRETVRGLLAAQSFDVVHADQLTMTQFALDAAGQSSRQPFTIFDAHNATWTISHRLAETVNPLLRPILRLETRRIQRYEGMLVERFDHTMVVIEQDRDNLLAGVAAERRAALAQRISVIPIAVDTRELQPVRRQPNSLNVMTLGSLNYPPNVDGIRWFVQEVFPLVQAQVPQVTLTIIGKSPPPDFVELAQQQPDTIDVTGYVPDLTPYMERAALMVVPVRAGSGMRVRLLEAFARAMPAVTTTIGLEGIEATHGREVLVADTAEAFAADVVRLLQDVALQDELAGNGRVLAETKYDWQVALRKMDAVFAQAKGAR